MPFHSNPTRYVGNECELNDFMSRKYNIKKSCIIPYLSQPNDVLKLWHQRRWAKRKPSRIELAILLRAMCALLQLSSPLLRRRKFMQTKIHLFISLFHSGRTGEKWCALKAVSNNDNVTPPGSCINFQFLFISQTHFYSNHRMCECSTK